MQGNAINVTKGVMVGVVIGAAVGMTVTAMTRKPPKSQLKKGTHKVLSTLENVVSNMADLTK